MEKSKRVATAECFIQCLDSVLDAPNISNDDRTWFGMACLEVARETYKAIVLCVAKSLPAPAFALLRTEYESYIRGIYLLQCASDQELSLVKRDKWSPQFADLISSVEKLEKYNAGALSELKTKSWATMNSFTHTGLQQIVRRRTELAIEPDSRKKMLPHCSTSQEALELLSILKSRLWRTGLLGETSWRIEYGPL